MFALPSSRRLAVITTTLLAIVTILKFIISITNLGPLLILNPSFSRPVNNVLRLKLHQDVNLQLSLNDQFVSQYHKSHHILPPNPQRAHLLSKCINRPNPHTNYIRLRSTPILNISMVPSAAEAKTQVTHFKNKQYFNPAILPLPSFVTASHPGYQYILISRLVTTGLHQESHACFAEIFTTDADSLSHTASQRPHTCTQSDLELLGPRGGLRCITAPVQLNVPPTPARKCSGAWASFPDIPGFHDPRVMWSGRAEPLVEVNSASAYGCVGLWMVDLRAVWEGLEEVLVRKTETEKIDQSVLGARMGYRHLTEITRNPRWSRSAIEKNWVLFFPTEEEMWVQYDIMGKMVQQKQRKEQQMVKSSGLQGQSMEIETKAVNFSMTAQSTSSALSEDENRNAMSKETSLLDTVLLPPQASLTTIDNSRPSSDSPQPLLDAVLTTNEVFSSSTTSLRTHSPTVSLSPDLESPLFEAGPAKRDEVPRTNTSHIFAGPSKTNVMSATSKLKTELTLRHPVTTDHHLLINTAAQLTINATNFTTTQKEDFPVSTSSFLHQLKGGRTLAQISFNHGYTTPNLTSPLEKPCFDLFSHNHTHDLLNNTGHWHQGSNSLRLVLCTREQFRARKCIATSETSSPHKPAQSQHEDDHEKLTWDNYEELLRREGLVVHFAFIHRKFSNHLDLPMRYERYVAVWEARRPFQMVAVSRWPLLFGGERARPWEQSEDLLNMTDTEKGDDGEGGATSFEDVESAYFTYTPSIAWAWRPKGEDENVYHERGHEDLGTGYLGDEIVVGVGMDDLRQGFVKTIVDHVLDCMRLCVDR